MESTSRTTVSRSNFNLTAMSNPNQRRRRSTTSISTTNRLRPNIFTSSPPSPSSSSPSFRLLPKFPSFRKNTRHKQGSVSRGAMALSKVRLLLNLDIFIVDLNLNLNLTSIFPFVLRLLNRSLCSSPSAMPPVPRLPNLAVTTVSRTSGNRLHPALLLEVQAFLTLPTSVHFLSPMSNLSTSAAAPLPTPSEILILVTCNRFHCCSGHFWLVQSIFYFP